MKQFFAIRCVALAGALFASFGVRAAPFAYISNSVSNSVSVIDTANTTVVGTVAVGNNPTGVAVSFDGARVYIANSGSNTVSVIDALNNRVVATVAVANSPAGVAVNPAGDRVYVTNGGSNSVSVIDATTNTVIATSPVGFNPKGVVFNPAGTRAYVANTDNNSVSVIDAATNGVITTIAVGLRPNGIAVNRDGSRVYVTNDDSNTVSVINGATNGVIANIAVDDSPNGIALSPDGARAYVANFGTNTVSVIGTANNSVLFALATGGVNPIGVAVTPDGSRVYVANTTSGGVSVIDTLANTITAVPVGLQPAAFGQFVVGVIAGAGTLQFGAADYSVNEGTASAIITVTRRDGNEGAVSAQFATSDGSAVAGVDYTATTATISFAAGESTRTTVVPIIDDVIAESNKTVSLTLSNPSGATLGARPTAILTIADNDTTTGSALGGGGGCSLFRSGVNSGASGVDFGPPLMLSAALLALLRQRFAPSVRLLALLRRSLSLAGRRR